MKKFLFGVLASTVIISCAEKAEEKKEEKSKEETATTTTETKKAATEILDISEADGVKAGITALANKDAIGLTASYTDNVALRWSGGDSAIGKQAAIDYWNGRFKLIDSISFTDNIFLPIKVNEPQSKYSTPGKWVLAWSFSHVKYKNGKWLNIASHTDYHYNDAGKIDEVIQYIDRHPIMEATKGLK